MAIKESDATALVRFTGLGIIIFNEEKKRGEIGIIRDENHELSFSIQKPRFKDGIDQDIVIYEDFLNFENLPKEDVTITISSVNNNGQGFEIYQDDGEFDRLSSEDFNDFRWVVSMNHLHQGNLLKNDNAQRYPLTKLFIEEGLFYVHKLDTETVFEMIEKEGDGTEKQREIFGNIAETIGVKLVADEVEIKISTGENEETHILKRSEFPYLVQIKNMNYDEDAAVSDMPDYYKYINSASGINYEFEVVSENKTVGGGVIGRNFCHLIEGGGGDITTIEDL